MNAVCMMLKMQLSIWHSPMNIHNVIKFDSFSFRSNKNSNNINGKSPREVGAVVP
jgi:hypothetical protein